MATFEYVMIPLAVASLHRRAVQHLTDGRHWMLLVMQPKTNSFSILNSVSTAKSYREAADDYVELFMYVF